MDHSGGALHPFLCLFFGFWVFVSFVLCLHSCFLFGLVSGGGLSGGCWVSLVWSLAVFVSLVAGEPDVRRPYMRVSWCLVAGESDIRRPYMRVSCGVCGLVSVYSHNWLFF